MFLCEDNIFLVKLMFCAIYEKELIFKYKVIDWKLLNLSYLEMLLRDVAIHRQNRLDKNYNIF